MAGISGRVVELRNWLGLIALLSNPNRANAAGLYSQMSTQGVLSDKTLFINLGYWPGVSDYDEACYALAKLLADAAGMGEGDRVLDAGFGFAEQDLFWSRTYRPASIVGLNITRLQVEIASRRVRDAGFADRVRLINGSATAMPIADRSVTKVVALESAFHFQTREQFFAEAFRVLAPGGRIALADLLCLPSESPRWSSKWALHRLGSSAWQIPLANLDTIDAYAGKLSNAGFANVQIRSIRDEVLLPFRAYVRTWLKTPQAKDRMSGPMRWLWRQASSGMKPGGALDYILASAIRP